MRKITQWLGLGAATALAACANVPDVNKVLGSQATTGTPFTQSLFQEYQAYTKLEAKTEVEWVDASQTAAKALRAGSGEAVQPDELSQYKLPATKIPELTSARERLMGYFADGAADRVPAAAAKAQVAFDCWLEQEAEGRPNGACRTTFLTHEPMLKKPISVTDVAPQAQHPSFKVYFDLGSAKLSSKSLQTIKEAATAQGQLHAPTLSVIGSTDAVGDPNANMQLARYRADAVKAELAKLGVNPGIIVEDALGERHLAVVTGDNVVEPRNRRVDITLDGQARAHGSYGDYGGYAYGGHGDAIGYAYGGYGQGSYGQGGYGRGDGYGYGDGANSFAVFFNPGSSQLTMEAIERLKQVVAAQKNMKPKLVSVVGSTDRTGSPETNARLARERARAVADEIAKLGGTTTSVDSRPGDDAWGGGFNGRARRVEILFGY